MIYLLIISLFVMAEDVSTQPKSATSAKEFLPHCVNSPSQIQRITQSIEANKKNQAKYSGYREALSSDSDAELVARLVYAETLGANCPHHNSTLAPRIAGVITNRVRLRRGDARSVVFQRDQFSSSMNIYSNSRYKDFLCPKDSTLWRSIMSSVRAAMDRPSSVVQPDTVNYFLYKHDPRWTKEPWRFTEDQAGQSEEARRCVRFFRVPGWK